MIPRLAVAVAAASLFAAGCGDDDGPGRADASVADAGLPDASAPDAAAPDAAIVCDLPAAGAPGGTCAVNADCDSAPEAGDGLCLAGVVGNGAWPAAGYCITSGCPAEGCAEGSACVTVSSGEVDTQFCMPECCEADTCGTGQLCSERLFADPLDINACLPGSAAARDGDPCASVADCNAHSICRFDPYIAPGGMCRTVGCTIGDDSTCAGGDATCIDEDGVDGVQVPGCVDACEVDADCRQDEGYRCHDGSAGGFGSFCRHPEVGEACEVATDCGVNPWVCRTGAEYPGGYCTVEACSPATPGTCPVRSTCYDPDAETADDEYCADDCTVGEVGACRTGYLCAIIEGEDNAVCVPAPV